MLFASGSKNQAETDLGRLEDRVNIQERDLVLLRDSLESRIVNLTSEWRQYQAELADLLDKIDHITKRHRKRQIRDAETDADPVEEAEPAQLSLQDATTERVLARRQNRGIRSENVQG